MRTASIVIAACVVMAGCLASRSSRRAETYAAEAARALDGGDYEKARAMAMKAVQEKPDVPEYSIALAFAAIKLNDSSEAKEHLNKALALLEHEMKRSPERAADCAMVLVCLGRKAEAKALLGNCAILSPESSTLRTLHNAFDEWSMELSEYSL